MGGGFAWHEPSTHESLSDASIFVEPLRNVKDLNLLAMRH